MEPPVGRRNNADQRRAEIVWALFDCLAEQGHETATIKAIAARAGLPHGVIHYYFKRKEDIVSELARAVVDRYSGMLEARLEDAGTRRKQVAVALDFVVDELIFNRPLNRVFFNLIQMAYQRESLHAVMTEMFRAYRGRFLAVLETVGGGKTNRTVGATVVALAEGFSLQWMIEPGVFTKSQVREALARAVGEPPPD